MVRYIVNCEVDNLLHGGFCPTKENVDETPGTVVLCTRPDFLSRLIGKEKLVIFVTIVQVGPSF